MSRLIDADALKEAVREWRYHGYYDKLIEVIDNAPTVEYPEQITVECDTEEDKQKLLSALRNARVTRVVEEERPHGEWIKYIRCIECSVCKDKFFADDEEENCQDYEPCTDLRFNFCPNCGADMRGGRE